MLVMKVNCKFICNEDIALPETEICSCLKLNQKQTELYFQLSCFKNNKKQESILAKDMLKTMLSQRYFGEEIEIIHLPSGKPQALVSGIAKETVSISHHSNYIAVCSARCTYVGVDVQSPINWCNFEKQKIAFTLREILNIDTMMSTMCLQEKLTFLWSAKESVYKALGIGLSKGMHHVEIVVTSQDSFNIFIHDSGYHIKDAAMYCMRIGDNICTIFQASS